MEPNRAGALYEAREKLSIYGKAYLALALSLIDDEAAAARIKTLLADISGQAITSATSTHWEEALVDYWNMNTDTRTTSIVLDTLAKLDPGNSLAPNAVRWLMGARKADRWETTQENAWAIMALTDWMAATGELEGDYDWQVTLNDAPLGEGTVTPDTVDEVTTLRAGIEELLLRSDQRPGHRPQRLGRSDGEGAALLHDAPQNLPAGGGGRAAQPRGDDQPRISPGRLRPDRPETDLPDHHPGQGGRRDRRQADGRRPELAVLRYRGRPAASGRQRRWTPA